MIKINIYTIFLTLALPCLALPCLALPCLVNNLNFLLNLPISKNIMSIYGIFEIFSIILYQNILKSNYIYFSNIKNDSNKICYINSS